MDGKGRVLDEGAQNHIAQYNDKTHLTPRKLPNTRYYEAIKKAAWNDSNSEQILT